MRTHLLSSEGGGRREDGGDNKCRDLPQLLCTLLLPTETLLGDHSVLSQLSHDRMKKID